MSENIYAPINAQVEEVIEETPNIKTFVLYPEAPFSFETGQFIELTVPGIGEAPFTPSSMPGQNPTIDVTIMNVGRVTSALHQMKAKNLVGVRGPYGVGYPLKDFEGKEILIVGGGVGLAPLRSLLFSLFKEIDKYKRVILKYGARTPNDIVYKNSLKEWAEFKKVEVEISVDKADDHSWLGKVGLVTTLLDKMNINLKNSVGVVCGPPVMMKFVTLKLLDLGFAHQDIYLSMEKNMSCGLGKCGHCRIGPYYACKDGPVFTYERIKGLDKIWD
jgi:NAD(P)H-flavin reductase